MRSTSTRVFWLVGVLVVVGGIGVAGVYKYLQARETRSAQETLSAVALLGSWGITGVPTCATGTIERSSGMGDELVSVTITAPADCGGLQPIFDQYSCLEFDASEGSFQNMYDLFGIQMNLPPFDEMKSCGRCDVSGVSKVSFIRFKGIDMITFDQIWLQGKLGD